MASEDGCGGQPRFLLKEVIIKRLFHIFPGMQEAYGKCADGRHYQVNQETKPPSQLCFYTM